MLCFRVLRFEGFRFRVESFAYQPVITANIYIYIYIYVCKHIYTDSLPHSTIYPDSLVQGFRPPEVF